MGEGSEAISRDFVFAANARFTWAILGENIRETKARGRAGEEGFRGIRVTRCSFKIAAKFSRRSFWVDMRVGK